MFGSGLSEKIRKCPSGAASREPRSAGVAPVHPVCYGGPSHCRQNLGYLILSDTWPLWGQRQSPPSHFASPVILNVAQLAWPVHMYANRSAVFTRKYTHTHRRVLLSLSRLREWAGRM
ncbi:unnamed protein product [Protopolystoma xenopodis]|uniref:Uncharacterized protein n=1 Tax=Protopolystoma xenopodis TaxID=117903 RepID=A0A448WPV0_9PLAT|nr:unnamed protein product [Protopolystoma xenopodis]